MWQARFAFLTSILLSSRALKETRLSELQAGKGYSLQSGDGCRGEWDGVTDGRRQQGQNERVEESLKMEASVGEAQNSVWGPVTLQMMARPGDESGPRLISRDLKIIVGSGSSWPAQALRNA